MKVKLSEVFELQIGKTPSRNNISYWNGNNKWISIADLSNANKYIYETKECITEAAVSDIGIKLVPKETIVMSFKLSIGKVAITQEDMYTNEAIMAFIDKGIFDIDINYIYYLFLVMDWLVGTNKAVMGLTLNKSVLSEKEIVLPDIKKQHEIVDKLTCLDFIITNKKKQLAKLDEIIKSRFIEMFGDPQINPYGFEKVTINDICSSIVRGPFGSALKKEFFVEPNNTTYKVYEQKNAIQKCAKIGTYYITEEKYEELKRFECFAGDIIMSCSGTMGELYQLPEDCERGIINQALCKFTLNKRILPIVFLVYMKQIIGKLETKGTGIKNIAAVSYIKNMTINLPSMKIQNQFAAFAQQVNKSELAVKASLEKLETLKKSLMQQYFG